MKNVFVVASLAALVFISCSKEESIDTTNGGGTGNTGGGGATISGALLARSVSTLSANDSIGIAYTYDNSKQLATHKSFFVVNGEKYINEALVTRNTSGIITKVVEKYTENTMGTQTIEYTVNYDAAKNRYTSKVSTATQAKDSVAFEYDATGKVVKETVYFNGGNTGGYVEMQKTEFTYDASGNLTKEKSYDYMPSSNSYTATSETTYQYDSKVNPVKIGLEAFVFGMYTNYSANNITKTTYTDFEDATQNSETTFAYTYNGENKPTKADVTYSIVGFPIPLQYYYQ